MTEFTQEDFIRSVACKCLRPPFWYEEEVAEALYLYMENANGYVPLVSDLSEA